MGPSGKRSPGSAGRRQHTSPCRPHTALTHTHTHGGCYRTTSTPPAQCELPVPLVCITLSTLLDIHWEVFYELWIQPPVLFLVCLHSRVGLLVFSRLLTTSRSGCVRLQTPRRTLAADHICGWAFELRHSQEAAEEPRSTASLLFS